MWNSSDALRRLTPRVALFHRCGRIAPAALLGHPLGVHVEEVAVEIERRIRDMAEAARPLPTIQQLQQGVRQDPEPLLNPASRDPIDVIFNNASLRDILNSMGMAAGQCPSRCSRA